MRDVSIAGAVVTTCAHHSILFILSRWIEISLPPAEVLDLLDEEVVSSVQVDSSTWIGLARGPCVR